MPNKLNYPEDFIDKIICGDALDIIRQMPDECVDVVVTSDLPAFYPIDFCDVLCYNN